MRHFNATLHVYETNGLAAQVFRNFDEDKSGSVDYDEFRKGLAHIGITLNDADFQNLIEVVDNDKSGCINYQEFVSLLRSVLCFLVFGTGSATSCSFGRN